jgi:hypothetical protein
MKKDKRGSDYQPHLQVRDVPSQGTVSRIRSCKNERSHHLMSGIESKCLYIFNWIPNICDVREQAKLNQEETLAIAKKCGIKHPTDPRTKESVIMTTDFLITVKGSMEIIDYARSVKPLEKLNPKTRGGKRTLEKLEIERCYWEARGINWAIITEQEIPEVLVQNIEWIYPYLHPDAVLPVAISEISMIYSILTQAVIQSNDSLAKVASDCDKVIKLKKGQCLALARYLIAKRKWLVDMNHPVRPEEKLIFLFPPLKRISATVMVS